jgi:phosphatidylserine/phosphatidylglycerophosphate/cardiolipin synthase-like enzyme
MTEHLYCTWAHRSGLPSNLRARFRDLDEFLRTLASSAHQRLVLVAPYLSEGGMIGLRSAIAVSAQRGAWVLLITSDLDECEALNRHAVSSLLEGSDGVLIRNRLRVLKVAKGLSGTFHAKFMLVDKQRGYLGSANFSLNGLERNFELGTALSEIEASTLDEMITYLEAAGELQDCTAEIC